MTIVSLWSVLSLSLSLSLSSPPLMIYVLASVCLVCPSFLDLHPTSLSIAFGQCNARRKHSSTPAFRRVDVQAFVVFFCGYRRSSGGSNWHTPTTISSLLPPVRWLSNSPRRSSFIFLSRQTHALMQYNATWAWPQAAFLCRGPMFGT